MYPRKKVCLLIGLVLFSALVCRAWASPNPTMSFRGDGVTIDVTFPEEAHPEENISHNLTITTNTAVEIQNITLFIYEPVNSTWQHIKNQTIVLPPLPANQSLPFVIKFAIPQNANGTLYCLLYVQTDQAASYSSYMFYTTRVSALTFSEMQNLYNQMLANYTQLQTNYQTLLNQYNSLLTDYTNSLANYTSLLNQYNDLQSRYNSEVSAYNSQLSANNKLSQDYNSLNTNYKASLNAITAAQSDYETLNTTKNSLQTSYNSLQNIYNTLNQTRNNLLAQLSSLQEAINNSESEASNSRTFVFIALMAVVGLIAIIIYLKKKEPEPYVVIRKETVAVNNPEEKQQPEQQQ